jgi:hypothetical protein
MYVPGYWQENKTMTTRRQLKFLFQEPGMLEAIAVNPAEPQTGAHKPSRGYHDSAIPDLLIDYRMESDQPFAWMSYNFHKTYPSVIWGLKLLMAAELFDVPQAALTAVPLHDAFSWAYAHFVLEDEVPNLPEKMDTTINLTRQVLRYAAAVA